MPLENISESEVCFRQPVKFVNGEQREELKNKLEACMKKLVAENYSNCAPNKAILI